METTETIPQERPQGLKTLCVLSFIGCGLMFLLCLLSIPKIVKSDEAKQREIEQIRGVSEQMADQIEAMYMDPNYKSALIQKLVIDLLFLGLTFTGVFMMWRLKKVGFYIYAASELIYYPIGYFFGQGGGDPQKMMASLPSIAQSFAIGFIALMIIQDLLFIFLYWRQTKYMK